MAVLVASSAALCGCGLDTDLRHAVVANQYVAEGTERLTTGDPRLIRSARWCFDRARELRPEDPQLARLLVTRYVIVGAPREAAQIIADGLAGTVDSHLRAQATACLEGGQQNETAFMRAVLADAPRDAELLMQCGMSLFVSAAEPAVRDKAMVLLDRAVELAPNDATILNNVGYTYADAGVRLTDALALVKRADMLSPNHGYIVDSVGWAYFRKGMLQEALPHLQRAGRISPDRPEIQYHLGKLYRQLGQPHQAQRHLRAALRLDPDYTEARIELDLCLELPRPVYG